MDFRKRKIGSDSFGIIPYIIAIPFIIGLFISSLYLKTWILASFATFALCIFMISYKPLNRIFYSQTAVSEKGLLRTKHIPVNDIRQIGLLVVLRTGDSFLMEGNIKLTTNHIEIYITNYQTVNAPAITDAGTAIKFDYRENVWDILKKNPDLQSALKRGEMIASKSEQFL